MSIAHEKESYHFNSDLVYFNGLYGFPLNAGMGQVYGGEYAVGVDGLMRIVGEDRLYTHPPEEIQHYPQARYLVELGHHEFMAGRFVAAEQAQPVYLRPWSGV